MLRTIIDDVPSVVLVLLTVVVTCSIALIMALSLVVLVDLSYPFSGDLAISSDPFESGAPAPFSGR